MRWPWSHDDTRALVAETAKDLRRAVMELEVETKRMADRIPPTEGGADDGKDR